MIYILASRKGGVGKSTLACNFAAILTAFGRKVAIADNDPQGSSRKWGNRRSELDLPSVPVLHCQAGKQAIKMIKDLAAVYPDVIVDLQGADGEANRYVLAMADVVILPFKPTEPDLEQLEYVAEMIGQLQEIRPAITVHYVINEAPTTTAVDKMEALQFCQSIGITPISTVIHNRKAYRRSMATGVGAFEGGDAKARNEIMNAFQEIFGITGVIPTFNTSKTQVVRGINV